MSVNRLIDPAAWMDHVARVHACPARNRRILAHAESLELPPGRYVEEICRETRRVLGGWRLGLLAPESRIAGLRGLRARDGRPEDDGGIAGTRRDFEASLFRTPHRITYALLFDSPERVPASLVRGYGDRLLELGRKTLEAEATVVLGDSVVDSEGLLEERGLCLLRRPGELLFDFRFEPLAALDAGDPFSLGDADYLEVQIHRPLVPGDLLDDFPLS